MHKDFVKWKNMKKFYISMQRQGRKLLPQPDGCTYTYGYRYRTPYAALLSAACCAPESTNFLIRTNCP